MVGTEKKHRDLMLPPPDETYVGSSSASSSSSSSDHDDGARKAVEMTCLGDKDDDQDDTHLWNPPPSAPTALQEDDLEEETVQGSRTLYRHSLEDDDDDDDDEWDDDEGGFAMSPPTNHGSRLYHPLGSRTGRTTCTTRIWQALSIVVLSLTVAVWYRFVGGPNSYPPAWMSSSSGSTSHYVATTKPSTHHHYAFTADEIRRMQQHLTPHPLYLDNTTGSVTRHQLLHLHHMKTGGTCTYCRSGSILDDETLTSAFFSFFGVFIFVAPLYIYLWFFLVVVWLHSKIQLHHRQPYDTLVVVVVVVA